MPKKQNKGRNPALVVVEWNDAFDGQLGWLNLEEYKPYFCQPITVGWLIPDFLDGHVTLMGTYLVDKNDHNRVHYTNPSHIPLGMVQSITYLDVPDTIKDINDF